LISDKIKTRIIKSGKSFLCNDNISEFIKPGEKELLQEEVAEKVEALLRSLIIDIDNDHNTQDTARRVSKMFCEEIFTGRYDEPPKITAFPNVTEYDQLYVTGPITIRSTCAHHWMPIVGRAYIGVYPGTKVIGLSKFNRIVDWIASRPQIQEELSEMIADKIELETEAQGVAVLVQAEHMCMTHRGVREHESDMTTAVMRGCFRTDPSIKQEFYNIVWGMK